jgi:hypothetical protein
MPYFPSNFLIASFRVRLINSGSSTAKAGKPMIDNTDPSISFEFDSRGKKLCNVVELRVNSSGKTWITLKKKFSSKIRLDV